LREFYAVVSNNLLQLLSRQTNHVLETLPIVKANNDHRSFILSTWVRSYETHARRLSIGPANCRIEPQDYRDGESRAAEKHWDKTHVVTGADGFTIHAWICAKEGALWHVYVPPNLRLSGVAKALISSVAGNNYCVSKPMPYQFSGHTVTYNPWLSG
jgi:hypothetical protein